jgi:type II pantothenate kinase
VGGTSLGGGMFLGLCNAMTGIKDYDELLLMSNQGTSKGELEDCLDHVNKDNVIKSLLYMTAYNISQLAFLWTKKLNINRVFFSGYFIRGH